MIAPSGALFLLLFRLGCSSGVGSALHSSVTLDLGTLALLRANPLTLGAPSRLTRGVWLLGVVGCLVFLWSVASTIGWLEPATTGYRVARLPTLFETVFWLPPLILMGLALGMSVGGVRVAFSEERLLVRSLWPSSKQDSYRWATFRYARFWEEQTRSRERLLVMRFVFEDADITLRVSNEQIWHQLRERFAAG